MNGARTGWEAAACDFCGSTLYSAFVEVAAGAESPSMKLVKCTQCGLVYLNPRPSPEAIGAFYGDDYYAHTGAQSRQKTLRARLKSRFIDGLGGYGASLDHALIRRLAPLGSVDVVVPRERRGRLLDVGCGDGERAHWYRDRDFQAYGVEVSKTAAAHARKSGIKVHQGTLAEARFPDRFFDVVIMAHVLEHTHSPKRYLDEAFRILKPGGMVAVAVPNIESHSFEVFRADWAFLMPPVHLYHFSAGTLTNYLRASGFAIEALVGKIVYASMARSSWRALRQHQPAGAAIRTWFRCGTLASSLAYLKCGVRKCDTITAYCIRPVG